MWKAGKTQNSLIALISVDLILELDVAIKILFGLFSKLLERSYFD